MDDMLRDFVSKTIESLVQIDAELVKLEQAPNDFALPDNIFQLFHALNETRNFIDLT
jgi:chemotaxis protein histidine kinase CheA